MQEAVSQILDERARDIDSMSRMLGVSIAAHIVLLALVIFLPAGWFSSSRSIDENALMIELGGVEGPETGGMTPVSGRTAQVQREPDAPPRPEPPPVADTSKMTLPTNVKPTPPKAPPKPVAKPAPQSTSKTPTTGAKPQTGSSKVDTGAPPVPFGGLASGGGGFGGVKTDFANFCCPSYLTTMLDLIRRNWQRQQGAVGTVSMKYTIQRDGTITNVEVEKSSGQALLDQAARRALLLTKLPPLPQEFPDRQLTVYLEFEFQR